MLTLIEGGLYLPHIYGWEWAYAANHASITIEF